MSALWNDGVVLHSLCHGVFSLLEGRNGIVSSWPLRPQSCCSLSKYLNDFFFASHLPSMS